MTQTSATILADSIGPHGVRLTTWELTYPRFIHSEFMTHRMISKNAASSRALPTEQKIEAIEQHGYVPQFCERVKGMGVGQLLKGDKQRQARSVWLSAKDHAVVAASSLRHVDKSRANRLLEPFDWITVIASGTDWDNFYALRAHPDAQPEFQELAYLMKDAYGAAKPQQLGWGEWHLPLTDGSAAKTDARPPGVPFPAEVSAGRCARVSYDKLHAEDKPKTSQQRWHRLAQSGHWSPGEHPARLPTAEEWYTTLEVANDIHGWAIPLEERLRMMRAVQYWGNFKGWVQLRKHYNNEEVFSQ